MRGFLLRVLISAFGIWLASEVVPGVRVDETRTIFLAGLLLGVVNAIVRPILTIVTLPITLLTLGLFLLVINAAMLGLVARLVPGFTLDGFGPALLGSLLVSVISWIASAYIGPSGRVERMRYSERR